MTRISIVSILLLLCVVPVSSTSEVDRHDGYWWDESGDAFKLGYVIGLSRGISHCGSAFAYFREDFLSDSISLDDCLNVLLLYGEYLIEFNIEGVTYGQMRDGINTLYEDYRNKQLPAVYLLPVVEMQVAGKSEAEIDSALQELRRISSEAK